MQESKDVEPLPGVGEPKTALEYPIRAFVRAGARVYDYGPKVGDNVRVRAGGPNANRENLFYSPDPKDFDCELVWLASELDFTTAPASEPPEGPAVGDFTLMYRDNGEAAWWTVIEVPVRGLFRDGQTFPAALASSRVSGRTTDAV